jgi:hypothetical protein
LRWSPSDKDEIAEALYKAEKANIQATLQALLTAGPGPEPAPLLVPRTLERRSAAVVVTQLFGVRAALLKRLSLVPEHARNQLDALLEQTVNQAIAIINQGKGVVSTLPLGHWGAVTPQTITSGAVWFAGNGNSSSGADAFSDTMATLNDPRHGRRAVDSQPTPSSLFDAVDITGLWCIMPGSALQPPASARPCKLCPAWFEPLRRADDAVPQQSKRVGREASPCRAGH